METKLAKNMPALIKYIKCTATTCEGVAAWNFHCRYSLFLLVQGICPGDVMHRTPLCQAGNDQDDRKNY